MIKIGVIGAAGLTGRAFIDLLDESPIRKLVTLIVPFTTERSLHEKFLSCGKEWYAQLLTNEALDGLDIVIGAVSAEVMKKWIPIMLDKNIWIVDKSPAYRMDTDVPLMVPCVNGEELLSLLQKNKDEKLSIVSSPNCITGPLAVILKPIQAEFGIKKLTISTFQSVSGYGEKGPKILFHESKQQFAPLNHPDVSLDSPTTRDAFEKAIAYNILPCVGELADKNGFSDEEIKMIEEIPKILNIPAAEIEIQAFATRVPVFRGHSVSVFVETHKNLPQRQGLRRLFDQYKHVSVVDRLDIETEGEKIAKWITPIEISGDNGVWMSRIRYCNETNFGFWGTWDNMTAGAAYNALEIVLFLYKNKLLYKD